MGGMKPNNSKHMLSFKLGFTGFWEISRGIKHSRLSGLMNFLVGAVQPNLRNIHRSRFGNRSYRFAIRKSLLPVRDSEIAPTGLRGEETEFWGKNSVSAEMVGVYLVWDCSELASGAAWAISVMASSGLT